MSRLHDLRTLPTFVALEALPVLTGQKRAASIKLTDTYVENRIAVLDKLDADGFADRVEALRESKETLHINIEINAFEKSVMRKAVEEFQESLHETPEVSYLQAGYPGDCIVVPEILDLKAGIEIGVRVYFFRKDEAPSPTEIIRRNVAAIIEEKPRTFEQYCGDLHGYPDCCVAQFLKRSPNRPSPEMRSVEPLQSRIRADLLGQPGVSIEEIVPDYFSNPYAWSFFARRFFPEPKCETARTHGKEIYDVLTAELNKVLARDYFRLNYALCYENTQTLVNGSRELPEVGTLGTEHVYFYVPFEGTRTVSRYRNS